MKPSDQLRKILIDCKQNRGNVVHLIRFISVEFEVPEVPKDVMFEKGYSQFAYSTYSKVQLISEFLDVMIELGYNSYGLNVKWLSNPQIRKALHTAYNKWLKFVLHNKPYLYRIYKRRSPFPMLTVIFTQLMRFRFLDNIHRHNEIKFARIPESLMCVWGTFAEDNKLGSSPAPTPTTSSPLSKHGTGETDAASPNGRDLSYIFNWDRQVIYRALATMARRVSCYELLGEEETDSNEPLEDFWWSLGSRCAVIVALFRNEKMSTQEQQVWLRNASCWWFYVEEKFDILSRLEGRMQRIEPSNCEGWDTLVRDLVVQQVELLTPEEFSDLYGKFVEVYRVCEYPPDVIITQWEIPSMPFKVREMFEICRPWELSMFLERVKLTGKTRALLYARGDEGYSVDRECKVGPLHEFMFYLFNEYMITNFSLKWYDACLISYTKLSDPQSLMKMKRPTSSPLIIKFFSRYCVISKSNPQKVWWSNDFSLVLGKWLSEVNHSYSGKILNLKVCNLIKAQFSR